MLKNKLTSAKQALNAFLIIPLHKKNNEIIEELETLAFTKRKLT